MMTIDDLANYIYTYSFRPKDAEDSVIEINELTIILSEFLSHISEFVDFDKESFTRKCKGIAPNLQ